MLSKKAQFFLISSVLVVSFLSAIQTQLGSYSESNSAAPAKLTEMHLFNSIEKQIIRICNKYESDSMGAANMPAMAEVIKLSKESLRERLMDLNVMITPGGLTDCGGSEAIITLNSDPGIRNKTISLG